MLNDVRLAFRSLGKAPGFAIAAVVTLALGIGANTAVFSVVNAILLRPMPHVDDPARLVRIYTSDFSGPLYGGSSYPDYVDFRDRAATLSGLAAFASGSLQLSRADVAEIIPGQAVSGNYFSMLGMRPALGRALVPDDDMPGRPLVAMISYALWQRSFDGDRAVVGRTIHVNGQPITIVGVAPRGFTGAWQRLAAPSQMWVSLTASTRLEDRRDRLQARGSRWLGMIGRLEPSATLQAARTELGGLAQQLHRAYPDAWTDVRERPRQVTVLNEAAARVPPDMQTAAIGFAGMLMVVVALVLLVACANVAHLFLARAVRRRREVAVKLSLGASRWRLVRQLLTEAVVLSAAGGALGLLLAVWLADLLVALRPTAAMPIAIDAQPDARVFLFAVVVSVGAALLFGLLPARQAGRLNLLTALRDQDTGARVARGRLALRDLLVVAEVAVSLLLISSAGLFVRSLQQASATDVGFQRDNVLLASFNLDLQGYTEERGHLFFSELLNRAQALPNVRGASLAQKVPLTLGGQRTWIQIAGYTPRRGEDMEFDINRVGPRYFETIRMPLALGRGFTPADRDGSPLVAVVNQAFARRFWRGDNPIGKRLSYSGGDSFAKVIGVVRDSAVRSLSEEQRLQVFVPYLQDYRGDMVLHLRTTGDPLAVLPAVRGEIRQLDPSLPVINPTTLREATAVSLFPQRLASSVLGGFSLVALLMAMVGLAGLLVHSVAARTREIGIRMAVGARSADLVRLIVQRGLGLVAAGAVLGSAASMVTGRLLDRFLFGISGADVVTMVSAVLILAAAGIAATYLPARQATKVDPVTALRAE
ncbi:MAG: FtsX-like permease family protein [Luteitalea sp.]|nr:FtsX-like permease family protein [Luteitalea sp.]